MNTRTKIYHEKQVRELCALHALNNLFQIEGFFNKRELDTICNSLAPDVWINPHKSVLGLGNYDINVIMAALQTKGFEAVWFDKRKDPSQLNVKNICGFILNVPSDYKFGFVMIPLRRRHWIAIKSIKGTYYNLDSKLNSPQIIGSENDLINFLKTELQNKDKELFIIVTSETAKKHEWMYDFSVEDNCVNSNSNSLT